MLRLYSMIFFNDSSEARCNIAVATVGWDIFGIPCTPRETHPAPRTSKANIIF